MIKKRIIKGLLVFCAVIIPAAASRPGAVTGTDETVITQEKNKESEKVSATKITDIGCMKTGIKLSWEKIPEADGYIIWRDGEKIKVIRENKTTYTDKKANKNGVKYLYRIEVFKRAGKDIKRSKLSAKKGQYFMKRNRLDSVYMKGENVYANWTVNSKCSGYEILYSKKSDFSDAKSIEIKGKKSNTKTFLLSNKSNYYVKIRDYRFTGKGETKRKCYSAWSSVCMLINWDSSKEFASNSILHTDGVTLYRSYAKHRMKKVICVNAGHGTIGGNSVKTLCHPDGSRKVTGGSTAKGEKKAAAVSSGTVLKNGMSEADATLNLAKTIKERLLKAGFDVLMIRDDKNINIDNVARTVFANEYANYHISLHYDSSENDKGAFYIGVPQIDSYLNMYPVSENYKKHTSLGNNIIKGFREAGVKIYGSGSMALDLTQTSYSKIASIDIEVGDRASDTSKQTLKKIAEGILKGLKHEIRI